MSWHSLYVVYDKDPEVNSLSDHGWIDISCAKEMLVFGTNLVVSANHDHQQPYSYTIGNHSSLTMMW